jgi:hypothetical protein
LARAYRHNPQVVPTLDTASLVEAHGPSVLLSPINSGATAYKPAARGQDTFKPIADYPFEAWKKKRGREDAIVELVVNGGVPDVADHVLAVHRVVQKAATELWRRRGASSDEGPFPPA